MTLVLLLKTVSSERVRQMTRIACNCQLIAWAVHVARMEMCEVLIRNPESMKPLVRHRSRCEDDTKTDLEII